MKNITIDSVMHPFPHTIGSDQTLAVAKDMLQEHGVRHLPVQFGGKLVGVISDRDINFAIAADKVAPEKILIRDASTSEPYIVGPNEPLAIVVRKMAHDRIGCTLVADKGQLKGIFTTVDACHLLAEILSGKVEQ